MHCNVAVTTLQGKYYVPLQAIVDDLHCAQGLPELDDTNESNRGVA